MINQEQIEALPYQSLEEIYEALPEDTKLHSIRVAEYVRNMHEVAEEIELDLYGEGEEGRVHEKFRDYAYLAGKYHEIGLILLPEHLRIADEKMTPEEKAEHDHHVEYGGMLIEYYRKKAEPEIEAHIQSIMNGTSPEAAKMSEENRKRLAERYRFHYEKYWKILRDGVMYHHEQPDGSGYPAGLTAQQIPLAAWLVAEADDLDKCTAYLHKEKAFQHGYEKLEAWYAERDPDDGSAELALSEMHLVLQFGKSRYEDIFRKHQSETKTIDCRPPVIEKSSDRSMQLRYREIRDHKSGKCMAFEARPFFFYEEEEEPIRYEEAYPEFERQDVVMPVWSYFLYESSDMLERMKAYQLYDIVLHFPILDGIPDKKKMIKEIKKWLEESEADTTKIVFTVDERLLKEDASITNLKKLQEMGLQIGITDYTGAVIPELELRELEIEKITDISEDAYQTEDEILAKYYI